MELVINTDGASRGNPGPASYGYVIKEKGGKLLYEEGKRIGVDTNNVAEYTAVLAAFEYVYANFSEKLPKSIEVVADSQLIIRQLAGVYKIKNENLKKIFLKIKHLEFKLGEVSYRSVPRAQNKEADKMANKALDS